MRNSLVTLFASPKETYKQHFIYNWCNLQFCSVYIWISVSNIHIIWFMHLTNVLMFFSWPLLLTNIIKKIVCISDSYIQEACTSGLWSCFLWPNHLLCHLSWALLTRFLGLWTLFLLSTQLQNTALIKPTAECLSAAESIDSAPITFPTLWS